MSVVHWAAEFRMKWIFIASGGAAGSVLRYAMQNAVNRLADVNFPFGTLAVNVVGCLCIGLLAAMFNGPVLVREEYRIGLTVGVLGGFTTFSAFGLETFLLANDGQLRWALANMAVSCMLGLMAVWCGYRLAEYWFGVA
jgi:CrcB protein